MKCGLKIYLTKKFAKIGGGFGRVEKEIGGWEGLLVCPSCIFISRHITFYDREQRPENTELIYTC